MDESTPIVPGADQPAGLNAPQRIQLDVSGMTCGACAARVEKKLNRVEGVRATVNYATRVATIDANPEISAAALCDVVDKAGYGAAERDSRPTPIADTDGDHASSLFRRLVVGLILFIPLADLSILFAVVPSARFAGWRFLLLVLAIPILTWCAAPFYRVAVKNLRARTASMETLVSMGILSATAWSVWTMFGSAATPAGSKSTGVWSAIWGSDAIYLEVATGVTVLVLAGRYFEARARSRAGGALRALAALTAKTVTIVAADGQEMTIPADELKEGQSFIVRPGETIATDGIITNGRASVDMSTMTGESRPVKATVADAVIGGTTALDGRLVVQAAAVGADTQLAGMMRLVEQAQSGKANAQRLADRISGIFVPTAIVIAILTVLGWLLVEGTAERAIAAGVAVLVIACPCALGLATPIAVMVSAGRGAQLGIFLKNHQAMDTSREIDTVVFDKTGTVTVGELTVTDVWVAEGQSRDEILAVVAGVEAASEHAVAAALVAACTGEVPPVKDFTAHPGQGVTGLVEGHSVRVGSPRWISASGSTPFGAASLRRTAHERGDSAVFVSIDDQLCAAIAIADTVKPSSAPAIAALDKAGIRTVLLTGDNLAVANRVAKQVGIDKVIAEVLPDEKVAVIAALQAEGRAVAMVGDGINDGPALATADLGLAIGRGADVAIGAADIILVRDDLRSAPAALSLANATKRTIRTNLIWAFGYNIAAIPIAAMGLLNPLIAGAAMALSSLFVVSNSLRLQNFGST
ncbi:heavy metal translocating P-type ATPase [Gordonia crocea]|uniref:heavy metal translocating P-type ATPase n=1 Tax=Gordonia crocea TaxID=589162 RepID=UPI00225E39F6|nr:heavy metal translocating P-type ATPase [Gordonia crocea]